MSDETKAVSDWNSNYQKLYNDVKSILSPKRFLHSEGVVKRALEYAEVYQLDKNLVRATAIAHDIAKELSKEEVEACIKKYGIKLDDIECINSNLLHAKIGACICADKYGFTEDMINAVRYHTTGRSNMSNLEKVIYLADATEENRKYEDIDYYVDLIKQDINKGMYEVCKWTVNYLLSINSQIHVDSINCYNYYNSSKI